MKERPILFSAPMVRAILDGRKTQTRRIIKPQPPAGVDIQRIADLRDLDGVAYKNHAMTVGQAYDTVFYSCPYGVPGDQMWVKESYRFGVEWDEESPNQVEPMGGPGIVWYAATDRLTEGWGKLRPSIHMPRWASRITLEVTGLRVERLQDITEADAIAEGVTETFDGPGGCHERTTAAENFRPLWESINGSASWAENPWVWVVEFQRQ